MGLIVAAVGLFVLGVSHSAYDLTSPGWWSWHELARKLYGLAAFALLGYLFYYAVMAESGRAALAESRLNSAFLTGSALGAYSAALEVAQRFAGSRESHVSNAIDILSGFLGGAIGALVAIARSRLAGRLPVQRPAKGLRDESGAR